MTREEWNRNHRTPDEYGGYKTRAEAIADGWTFHTDERGYHGNLPEMSATSPTGIEFRWDGNMRHGGVSGWYHCRGPYRG